MRGILIRNIFIILVLISFVTEAAAKKKTKEPTTNSKKPSTNPSRFPTPQPSSKAPTTSPTRSRPSNFPSRQPTKSPTTSPTISRPSHFPSRQPTKSPTLEGQVNVVPNILFVYKLAGINSNHDFSIENQQSNQVTVEYSYVCNTPSLCNKISLKFNRSSQSIPSRTTEKSVFQLFDSIPNDEQGDVVKVELTISIKITTKKNVKTKQLPVVVTIILNCPIGYFSLDGKSNCQQCFKGTYSNQPGSTTCTSCPVILPTTLSAGSTSINDCQVLGSSGFLKLTNPQPNGMKIAKCPSYGVNCSFDGVTDANMIILSGFWRSSNTSLDVKRCTRTDFCIGNENKTMFERETSSFVSLCRANHTGAYCEICANDLKKTSLFSYCSKTCVDPTSDIAIVAGVSFGLFVGLFILIVLFSAIIPDQVLNIEKNNALLGVLIILIGFFQLVGGASKAVSYYSTLNVATTSIGIFFSFISLDFLEIMNFNCATSSNANVYQSLLISTLLPLSIILFYYIVFHICIKNICFPKRRAHYELIYQLERQKEETQYQTDITAIGERIAVLNRINDKRNKIDMVDSFLLFFFLILIYPGVSFVILRVFPYEKIDQTRTVLLYDHTLPYGSTSAWFGYTIYASILIIFFIIGIPLLLFYRLFSLRNLLLPFSKFSQTPIPYKMREKLPYIQNTKFLWNAYKIEYYYWICIDLFMRFMQVAITLVVPVGSQSIYLMLITACYISILTKVNPYATNGLNFLAHLSQVAFFWICFVFFLVQAGLVNSNNQKLVQDIVLALIIIIPIIAFGYVVYKTFFPKRKLEGGKCFQKEEKLVDEISFRSFPISATDIDRAHLTLNLLKETEKVLDDFNETAEKVITQVDENEVVFY